MFANTEYSLTDQSDLFPSLNPLWNETTGSPQICIAVLDGPVDYSHPCFTGASLTRMTTLASKPADQGMASQHGTHVASVIFGHHQGPVRGIAPGCRGIIVPVFEDGNDGRLASCSQLDLARAIMQAVDEGANVINISGGEPGASDQISHFLLQAIHYCADKNVLIVAAAGNDGCQCTHIPAAGPNVLVVGATDSQNMPENYSNWGSVYQNRGILVPGENILGAMPGGDTTTKSGTSFVTPIVSGIVGLLLSIQLVRGDKPDPGFISKAILESAHPCNPEIISDCRRFLAGSLNIPGAYALVTKTGTLEPAAQITEISPAAGNSPHEGQELTPSKTEFPVGLSEVAPSREEFPVGLSEVAPSREEFPVGLSEVTPSREEFPVTPSEVAPSKKEFPVTPPGKEYMSAPFSQKKQPKGETKTGHIKPNCFGPGPGKPNLVYALGRIGYDFGTMTQRDIFRKNMGDIRNPDIPSHFLSHVDDYPYEAANVIWTLTADTVPIYAIRPAPAFSGTTFKRLHKYSEQQLAESVRQVSIPGAIAGMVRLLSGQVVPIIVPELRGISGWSADTLILNLLGEPPDDENEKLEYEKNKAGILNFLERVFYELRNPGLSPRERAINYAATNAFQIKEVFESAIKEKMVLKDINAEPAAVCRPGSECWEVRLEFFDPEKRTERAKKAYRFVADVSEVIPVTMGKVRSWSIY
ncbi:MAG: PatA/PatG family cyanobactin maturation protease [Desulfobacterales bacterium]|nr:PatA/PatG family cyanobactin maturation protease [Desulfobacterales bacterium]